MSADHAGPTMLPMPISQMGPWYFWARHDSVGLPPADAAAIRFGTATPEQVGRAEVAAAEAFLALRDADSPMCQGRPS